MRFCVFPVKNVLETHSSREMIEVTQELFFNLHLVCHGCRKVFSPFASKLIWSFVSFLSDRFLMCFLFASKRVFNSFLCLFFSEFFLPFCQLTLGGVFLFFK